ncbi:MAG: polysaccharide deacetylase family protein [Clostridia bacterium]|nr:polysaccharide deacetylase family protein [Clostridia bacterium]
MEKRRVVFPICFLIIISLIFCCFGEDYEKYDKEPKLNVLMLHMVTKEMPEDSSLDTLYITDKMLKSYCEYFKDRYTIVSLDEAFDIIKNNKELENPNLLAFTFDDGYDNNYTLAYPILKELGIKANINIIARYTNENYPGYLTWDEIKEMSDSGLITFGNHTYDSHYYTEDANGDSRPVLSALLSGESSEERRKRIMTDLKLADNMISQATGKDINVIAYPYGVPPFDLMSEIKDELGYDIQMLVRTGVNKTKEQFGKLSRFTVNGNQSPKDLEREMKRYKGLNFLEVLKY